MCNCVNNVKLLSGTVEHYGYFIFPLLGLIWGSFLNVCIYRWPQDPPDNNVITPRSYCPHCKNTILWYDNIPLLSFLLLRGKCRYCGKPISWRYPFVELFSAFIWLFCYMTFGLSIKMWIFILYFSLLFVASVVDFEHRIIPDEVSIGGIVLGLILSAFFPQLHNSNFHITGFLRSFLGMLTGGVLIYLIAIIGEWAFKKEAMGGGDVKFQAMIGAFLGWKCAIMSFFIGCFVGSAIGIYNIIRYKDNTLPFGPCLAIGSVICMFWGEKLLHWFFPALYV